MLLKCAEGVFFFCRCRTLAYVFKRVSSVVKVFSLFGWLIFV